MSLDFSGRQQLYYQLYDLLQQEIIQGVYEVGCKIPAESELMNTYQVSRATVRKAMDLLSNDGYIEKRQGHGTYVINNMMKNSLKRVIRYHKMNEENNVSAIKKMVSSQEVLATKEIAQHLHIEEGTPLIRIHRVRYATDTPMYCEINYFEKSWAPALLGKDFSKESLRVFLADYYHVRYAHAIQEIYALKADDMATHLTCQKEDPVLFIKRVSYDSKDIPREYVESYYRYDAYHLEMELAM